VKHFQMGFDATARTTRPDNRHALF
jgi:hypothetical protein